MNLFLIIIHQSKIILKSSTTTKIPTTTEQPPVRGLKVQNFPEFSDYTENDVLDFAIFARAKT